MQTNLIGISSCATGGKDTLFNILNEIFKENYINSTRIALADPLKADINDFTKSKYGISAFTVSPKEKETIRPLMGIHGKIMRDLTQGLHWTGIAQLTLQNNIKDNLLSICTDIRYCKYSTDEIHWVKKNNGIVVHVERVNLDGTLVGPINSDEAENDPKVKERADFHLKWPTTDDLDLRKDCVKLQLADLIEKIINERR